MDLAAQLKKGKGLCVVALILEGNYVDLADEAKDLEDELEQAMEGTGLQGFAHAVVFPTFRQGRSAALQLAGLGVLTPNTVLQVCVSRERCPPAACRARFSPVAPAFSP